MMIIINQKKKKNAMIFISGLEWNAQQEGHQRGRWKTLRWIASIKSAGSTENATHGIWHSLCWMPTKLPSWNVFKLTKKHTDDERTISPLTNDIRHNNPEKDNNFDAQQTQWNLNWAHRTAINDSNWRFSIFDFSLFFTFHLQSFGWKMKVFSRNFTTLFL